ncbi:4-hydroxythreonine-4-phosphate dehydrogenase PdxA [Candidatus Liberibacter sp.]|uniref:4-hydroxythreonine-4-phosphate dehydrogenase PdxA n=1 Tax=Candidatus Liberibacter sp. TaxID=34022 RepID=UPI0015F5628F|nr:4-hydroxythreonine-4-phosphate dehydrogenase PdxA [Candidatus Liberibacter sp.]MBA5724225.1 4-hydroxythreonine-4-phosphate dehydrogenase PdxA [Candidatus Liberibacter sp.]
MEEFILSSPLVLTQGDPAGIGPDISLKAWLNRKNRAVPPFLYIGDPDVLRSRAKQLNITVPLYETDCSNAISIFTHALPIISSPCGAKIIAGIPKSATVPSTIATIEKAVSLTLSGKALAMVTNPISKSVFYEADFKFPGHTEFLAELVQRNIGMTCKPVMMLAGPRLRAVPITIHIPLTKISQTLSQQLIIETCHTVYHAMEEYFNIKNPRLAVSGLNPHAGENANIGLEECNIICPAIAQLQNENIQISGPLSADSMFHDSARQHYDVAICMYHDQALIPTKTLDFNETVNITLGLPFIRTSPDHGTAFNIAGTKGSQEDSLLSALKMGARLGYQKICSQ